MTPDEFVDQCRSYDGVSFWHCGRSVNGVDCIGLPICAARDLGVHLYDPERYAPHVDAAALVAGLLRECHAVPVDERRIGDLLLFKARGNPQHVAVLVEENRMIHSWDSVGKVAEHELTPAWLKMLHSVYRWKGW